MGGDEHVAVLTPLAPSVPATATTGPRTLPVASDAQACTPRPDAITFEVSGEAELERLAELAWKGPGAPRTALVARGVDMEVLTRALRHAEGAYLRLDTLIYGVATLPRATHAAGKALILQASSVDTLVAAAHEAVAAGLHDVALALRAEDPPAVLLSHRLLARLDAEGLGRAAAPALRRRRAAHPCCSRARRAAVRRHRR